jgi:hypothetical protein
MRVVLSHPFSGSVYWWFAQQVPHIDPIQKSKTPGHEYYRTLYGDVDKHLDIALACAVVFEEVLLPAADAVFLGNSTRGGRRELPELNMIVDWEYLDAGRRLIEPITHDLLEDEVIGAVLRRVPDWGKEMALEYAATDIIMSAEHEAPVICAPGRRRLVLRLLELDVIGRDVAKVPSLKHGAIVGPALDKYEKIVGLTFSSDDVGSLAEIKWEETIRQYAKGFQAALLDPENTDYQDFLERIATAWISSKSAEEVSGAFSAASRTLSVVGLVPGAGTVAGVAGIGTDAAGAAADRRAKNLRWYQLGPEIQRLRSLRALEEELRTNGLV